MLRTSNQKCEVSKTEGLVLIEVIFPKWGGMDLVAETQKKKSKR